jgi:hypothetical protein
MKLSGSASVALTYANDKLTDGAGAQLLRIYGVYAISRALGLPYIHSPLTRIGYQGLSALERNSASDGVVSEYNRIFGIPSDIELPELPIARDMGHANLGQIMRIRSDARQTNEFHLIRIQFPQSVTDRYPEMYGAVKAISPFPQVRSEASGDVFRLAIHVRRGELFAVDSHRMLPNSYYISCARAFVRHLKKLDIPFVCELYTEVPSAKFVVTPQHHGIEERIPGNITIDPRANCIEDFDVIPHLTKFINGDPIESLRRMATADALVISASCFSYVPAILNRSGIVVYHPCAHGPLKDWLVSDRHGLVSDSELIAPLESWKRERCIEGGPKRSSVRFRGIIH